MFETRAPGAKFTQIGDGVDGEIVGVRRTQQTEFKTNIPLYWENKTKSTHGVNPATGRPNDPMLQTEITVDTGVPDENGVTERRLFVRGKRMTDSLKHAVQQGGGGGDGLLIGGRLACTFYGTEPSAGGGSDAKLYRFAYAPPAAGEGRRPDPTPVLYDGAGGDDPARARRSRWCRSATGNVQHWATCAGVRDRLHASTPSRSPPRQADDHLECRTPVLDQPFG
jgi:hypothetical protein